MLSNLWNGLLKFVFGSHNNHIQLNIWNENLPVRGFKGQNVPKNYTGR